MGLIKSKRFSVFYFHNKLELNGQRKRNIINALQKWMGFSERYVR